MEQNIYKLVFKVTHAEGSGSCFYLKSCNLFVTNYHVVEGFHAVAIHDSERNPYLAKVVLVNPALDIALLAVEHDFPCCLISRWQVMTRLPLAVKLGWQVILTECHLRSLKGLSLLLNN